MADIIYIEMWFEEKLNDLAQQYRKCKGTCIEKEMEDRLRNLGLRLARYKQFSMHIQKEGE